MRVSFAQDLQVQLTGGNWRFGNPSRPCCQQEHDAEVRDFGERALAVINDCFVVDDKDMSFSSYMA